MPMTEEEKREFEELKKMREEKNKEKLNQQNQDLDDNEDADENEEDFDALSKEELISKLKNTGKTIKELRKENAKRRVENKEFKSGLEAMSNELSGFKGGIAKALGLSREDDLKPEEQIGVLQEQNLNLESRLAFLEICNEHGIVGEKNQKYFNYLLNEKMSHLDEDEELPEEVFNEILEEVNARGFNNSKRSKTSVDGSGKGDSGNPPINNENQDLFKGDMTVEKFVKLSITEQGYYYGKNPVHAQKLLDEAAKRGLLG